MKNNAFPLFPGGTRLKKNRSLFTSLSREILLTDQDKLDVKYKENRSKVIEFLRNQEQATTSEIAEAFDLNYEDTHYILKRLEEDNQILVE